MAEQSEELLSVAETAKMLSRSTEQVRRYLREGTLPGRRLGGQWFIDRANAQALLVRLRDGHDFSRRLAASDPDPLGQVVALGGSGGGDIANARAGHVPAAGVNDRG